MAGMVLRVLCAVVAVLFLVQLAAADGVFSYSCASNCAIIEGTQSYLLNVPDSSIINSVIVEVNLHHNFLGDLEIFLESPGGATVSLLEYECDDLDDLNAVFMDGGLDPLCVQNASGPVEPETPLSGFNGDAAAGPWLLGIYDDFGEGGFMNDFTLFINTEYEPQEPSGGGSAPFSFAGPRADALWYMYVPGCARVQFMQDVAEVDIYLVQSEEEEEIFLGSYSAVAGQAFEVDLSAHQLHPGPVYLVAESGDHVAFSEEFTLVVNGLYFVPATECEFNPVADDSCFDRCGDQAPAGCYCDSVCEEEGDCCPDACICNVCSTSGTCAGRCGDDTGSCSCDPLTCGSGGYGEYGEYYSAPCCPDADNCLGTQSCAGRCGDSGGPCSCDLYSCGSEGEPCCPDIDECFSLDSCQFRCGSSFGPCSCDIFTCGFEGAPCCADLCDFCPCVVR